MFLTNVSETSSLVVEITLNMTAQLSKIRGPELNPLQIWWIWTIATAFGATVGSVAAVLFFPGAAFGENPTGVYGSTVYGFAFWLAVVFALSQWIALQNLVRGQSVSLLWVPATVLGIMSMVLPLWNLSAEYFLMTAFYSLTFLWAVPLLPGALVLGLLQWCLLSWWFRPKGIRFVQGWLYVLLTLAGTITGSIFAGFSLTLTRQSGALEFLWALMIGLGIGAFQGYALARIITSQDTR